MNKNVRLAFKLARKLALKSTFRFHLGCVITYKGVPIAEGMSSEKTHPMQEEYNRYRANNTKEFFIPKVHAEIDALAKIRELDIDFSKVCLYVYRLTKDKPFAMARPCPSCMQAIKDLGIKTIYYTTYDGFAKEILKSI